MKLYLMPRESSWWIWLLTALALLAGVSGLWIGFALAVLLSGAQAAWVWGRKRSVKAFPVQIRLAYALLLLVCSLPYMGWLFWLPTLGTFALVLFGYCLTARLLSLMPWNRGEALTFCLLARTLLTPPVLGNVRHGLPASCEQLSVCELEAQVASLKLP